MSNAAMEWKPAQKLMADIESMGVQGLEMTGGGEPLMWPHIRPALLQLANMRVRLSMVTHGALFNRGIAELWGRTNWRWTRVSIDAGSAKTYCAVRRVSETQWHRAWEGVKRMASLVTRKDQRVGVGFVVTKDNFNEVYDCARLAAESGADNMRVSLMFAPEDERVPAECVRIASHQASRAQADFPRLQVINLVDVRDDDQHTTQDYPLCASQFVTTVVGGDGGVYRCCTQAFTQRGLIGRLEDHGNSLAALWDAVGPDYDHDPRVSCQEPCLYRERNLRALDLIEGRTPMATKHEPKPLHLEFP